MAAKNMNPNHWRKMYVIMLVYVVYHFTSMTQTYHRNGRITESQKNNIYRVIIEEELIEYIRDLYRK